MFISTGILYKRGAEEELLGNLLHVMQHLQPWIKWEERTWCNSLLFMQLKIEVS